MFYSTQILARKGPLGLVWIAAHMDRGLKRSQVYEASIPSTVDVLLSPEAPLALRLSGQLLLGVCRIYSRKVSYLLQDCQDALIRIRLAFRPEHIAALTKAAAGARGRRRRGAGDADGADAPAHTLPLESITLPDDLEELQLLAGGKFDVRTLQPAMALEALLAELQQMQGSGPDGARGRRAAMGFSVGAAPTGSGLQEGYSLGLLFAPSEQFSGGDGGLAVGPEIEMEVFEDAGAPFEFDLEEVEIERLRAAPASEASGGGRHGGADMAALLAGELSAGGLTRGAVVGDEDDASGSGSPSSGLLGAASRERESTGMSVDRRRSTAAAATTAATGGGDGRAGGSKMAEARLGELLPDLGLDTAGGGLDLAMDLGLSEERPEGEGGGTAGRTRTPGASGSWRPAVSGSGADVGAMAATTSAVRTGMAVPSQGVSFTDEEIRAAAAAMELATAGIDPYEIPPEAHAGDDSVAQAPAAAGPPERDAQERIPCFDAEGDVEIMEGGGDAGPAQGVPQLRATRRRLGPADAAEVRAAAEDLPAAVTGQAAATAHATTATAPSTEGAAVAATVVDGADQPGVDVVGAMEVEGNSDGTGLAPASVGPVRRSASVQAAQPGDSQNRFVAQALSASLAGALSGTGQLVESGAVQASERTMSDAAAMSSGGAGGVATASGDSSSGGADEAGQAVAAVKAASPPRRMMTRRSSAAAAAAAATIIAATAPVPAAVPTEPAPEAAGADAGAAGIEDQAAAPLPAKATVRRVRAAQAAGRRSVTFDQEGATIPTVHLREWLQDRSELLEATRLHGRPSTAVPAAQQQVQAYKRRRVAGYDPINAGTFTLGAAGPPVDLLTSTEPAALKPWPHVMSTAAGPSGAAAAVAPRQLGSRRHPAQQPVGAVLAPSIQALFNVALGRMAPQYALEMGAAAGMRPPGLPHESPVAAAAGPGSPVGAAPGLAGAGTPAAGAGVGAVAVVPALSAGAPGSGVAAACAAPGTPSVQRQGPSLVGGAKTPVRGSGSNSGEARGPGGNTAGVGGERHIQHSHKDAGERDGGDGDEEMAVDSGSAGLLGAAPGGGGASNSGGSSGRGLGSEGYVERHRGTYSAAIEQEEEDQENRHAHLTAVLGQPGAAAAGGESELSLGHEDSEKENRRSPSAAKNVPRSRGFLTSPAGHRPPLAPRRQSPSTPSSAAARVPAASRERTPGIGGRVGAGAAVAPPGASTAAEDEDAWLRRGSLGPWHGHHEGHGGGLTDMMDVEVDKDISGSQGNRRSLGLGAGHEHEVADAMELDVGAAEIVQGGQGHVRPTGPRGTSGASVPSVQRSPGGSGGGAAAAAIAHVGAPAPAPAPQPLATPPQSQQPARSGMQLRSHSRRQARASQQHDAAARAPGTPLIAGGDDEEGGAMSISEGLGLGSMLRRHHRSRLIDDAAYDGGGDGEGGEAVEAARDDAVLSAPGAGSFSSRQECQDGRTPSRLLWPAAGGPDSHGTTDGAASDALRTGLRSSSGSDYSRERDGSLTSRTLQEFDNVARVIATAAVAAAATRGSQLASAEPHHDSGMPKAGTLPVGLDLLRRPFSCAASQQPFISGKPHEKRLSYVAAAATQHPTQLRSDGNSENQGIGPASQQAAGAILTQLRPDPALAGQGGGQAALLPPWSETLLFCASAAGGDTTGGSQAGGCVAGAARLSELTRGRSRKDAARCFLDMLVLKSRGLVDLKQQAITVSSTAAEEAGTSAGGAAGSMAPGMAFPDVWVTLTQRGVDAASVRLLARPASLSIREQGSRG